MGLSEDLFDSFVIYQRRMEKEFKRMEKKYGLVPIDADRSIIEVNEDLQNRIDRYLDGKKTLGLRAPSASFVQYESSAKDVKDALREYLGDPNEANVHDAQELPAKARRRPQGLAEEGAEGGQVAGGLRGEVPQAAQAHLADQGHRHANQETDAAELRPVDRGHCQEAQDSGRRAVGAVCASTKAVRLETFVAFSCRKPDFHLSGKMLRHHLSPQRTRPG